MLYTTVLGRMWSKFVSGFASWITQSHIFYSSEFKTNGGACLLLVCEWFFHPEMVESFVWLIELKKRVADIAVDSRHDLRSTI